MSFISPLSPMQKAVWSLLNKGLSMSQVADELKTSPQYVHQTRRNAEAKLTRALTEAAEAGSIQVNRIRASEGLLWGYHPGLQLDAVVSYTTKDGVKIWYWYDNPEEVTDETFLQETKQYLLNLAEERHISLSDEEKQLHPGKLANHIFRELLPVVKS